MMKEEVRSGRIQGIKLPVEDRQQVIEQYADNTSLTLLGVETSVRACIDTLQIFCMGCGLVLNWGKSCGYWKFGANLDRASGSSVGG
jgi:hypothetical protein